MAARTKSGATSKSYRPRTDEVPRAELGHLREIPTMPGDLTIRFDEGAIGAWNASSSGLPGGQRRHSDLAILTALTLRTAYHLALRQTAGFVASLLGLTGLEIVNRMTVLGMPESQAIRA
jgi:hypothetical protein